MEEGKLKRTCDDIIAELMVAIAVVA